MTAMDIIAVSKHFGQIRALKDVSFSIPEGEILALLGPSGCGKTTTLRVIAGFELPDKGAIRIGGQDVTRKRPYERNFGFVFQDYALFPHMTVGQNIAYGVRHRRFREAPVDTRVAEMLRLVHLDEYGSRYPRELSGGQKQRIALARALAPNPAVLLLDEPLSALDAAIRIELRAELRRLLKDVGSTTVIVTHDQEEAMTIADRIVLMDKGEIVQEGAPLEVYEMPNCRFAANFMGNCNWLNGRVVGRTSMGLLQVQLPSGQLVQARTSPDAFASKVDIEIGLRPEHITIEDFGESCDGKDLAVSRIFGVISSIQATGAQTILTIQLGAAQSVLLSAPRRTVGLRSIGDKVYLHINSTDVIILPSR